MKRWYVLHTQTGSEYKVKALLENKVKTMNLKDRVHNIFIPTEQVSEVKKGKKSIGERKFFPGYILVELDLDEEVWYAMRSTPGVTGFIGAGNKPTPLTEKEVNEIMKRNQEAKEKPTPRIMFSTGEAVRVIEGPFLNFSGVVDEVYPDKGKIKVSVAIFGRTTPVELEFWQVEKI